MTATSPVPRSVSSPVAFPRLRNDQAVGLGYDMPSTASSEIEGRGGQSRPRPRSNSVATSEEEITTPMAEARSDRERLGLALENFRGESERFRTFLYPRE